jgi:hypothetical protein
VSFRPTELRLIWRPFPSSPPPVDVVHGLICPSLQLITLFLVERVHIVHGQEEPRRGKNKIYLFNCLLIASWLGIFCWLIAQQMTEIRPSDGECRFFIAPGASAAGGVLDVLIISYLSLLFAIPLYRGR